MNQVFLRILSFGSQFCLGMNAIAQNDLMTPAEIKRGLANLSILPIGLQTEEKATVPKNWDSSQLILGKPRYLQRDKIKTEYMSLLLSSTKYFHGNGSEIGLLNTCLRDWSEGISEETKSCSKDTLAIDHKTRVVDQHTVMSSQLLAALYSLSAGGEFALENPDRFFKDLSMALRDAKVTNRVTVSHAQFNAKKANQPSKPLIARALDINGSGSVTPQAWLADISAFALWNGAVSTFSKQKWRNLFNIYDFFSTLNRENPRLLLQNRPMLLALDESSSTLRIVPSSMNDMLGAVDLMKSEAFLRNKSQVDSIITASQSAESIQDLNLKSLVYLNMANLFYDLSQFSIARRFYALSVNTSQAVFGLLPEALFFGAESAFWQGDFEIAKQALLKYLTVGKDKYWVPWARHRLIDIAHVQKSDTYVAEVQFLRNFPDHPATLETSVRKFCVEYDTMSGAALSTALQDINDLAEKAGSHLREQALACAILSRMKLLQNKVLISESNAIVSKINDFNKEFPKSTYAIQFTSVGKDFGLVPIVQFANDWDCSKLLDAVKAYKQTLPQTDVPSVGWQVENLKRIGRCAVSYGNMAVWDRYFGLESKPLQLSLRKFLNQSNDGHAKDLMQQLVKLNLTAWSENVIDQGKFKKENLSSLRFWESAAISALDTAMRFAKEPFLKLHKDYFAWVGADPKRLWSDSRVCGIWLSRDHSMSAWNTVMGASAESEIVDTEDCFFELKKQYLTKSIANSNSNLEERVILPWLNTLGVDQGSHEWMLWADRLKKLGRRTEAKVIYSNLSENSENAIIQDNAKQKLR